MGRRLRWLSVTCLIVLTSLGAGAEPPFIVGEWASDCSAEFRIGYRLDTDGSLIAYTLNKGVVTDFGWPKVRSEDAESFILDFADGLPITWKKRGQTIQPWSQGEGGSVIKEGIRDGSPTAIFRRCRQAGSP